MDKPIAHVAGFAAAFGCGEWGRLAGLWYCLITKKN